MRWVLLGVILAGCGRANFDPLTDDGSSGGDGGESSGDTMSVPDGGGSGAGTPCLAINDSAAFDDDSSTGTNVIIGIRLSTATALSVVRAELVTGESEQTSALALWSHDGNTNMPLAELGIAPLPVGMGVQWYGADFPAPISVGAGFFWLAWTLPSVSLQSSVEVGSGSSTFPTFRPSTDDGVSWGPALSLAAWKVRLYCDPPTA